jgi:hypothetical protein
MGVDHNIYIGGYVKVRMQVKRVLTGPTHKLGCKLDSNESKQSGKFCSDCGVDLSTKTATLEYKDTYSVVGDSFWVANGEDMCHRPGKTTFTEKAEEWEFIAILVPNNDCGHSIDAYEELEFKINSSVIDAGMHKFYNSNEKKITKLKKAYGEENIETYFGVIAYCS